MCDVCRRYMEVCGGNVEVCGGNVCTCGFMRMCVGCVQLEGKGRERLCNIIMPQIMLPHVMS